jgi:hypothetical protein
VSTFIELTTEDKESIWVNMDQVRSFIVMSAGTEIMYTTPDADHRSFFWVRETPAEILQKMSAT